MSAWIVLWLIIPIHVSMTRFFFEKEPKQDGKKNIPNFFRISESKGKNVRRNEWKNEEVIFLCAFFVEQCENRNIIDITTTSMHAMNQCAAGQNDERSQLETTRQKKRAKANKCVVLCYTICVCTSIDCSHFSLNLINYLAKIAFCFVDFFWCIRWMRLELVALKIDTAQFDK